MQLLYYNTILFLKTILNNPGIITPRMLSPLIHIRRCCCASHRLHRVLLCTVIITVFFRSEINFLQICNVKWTDAKFMNMRMRTSVCITIWGYMNQGWPRCPSRFATAVRPGGWVRFAEDAPGPRSPCTARRREQAIRLSRPAARPIGGLVRSSPHSLR